MDSHMEEHGSPEHLHPELHKKSSGWLSWVIILALLGAAGWYFRDTFTGKAAPANSPGASNKRGGSGRAVPVVVANASRGDMPVYLRNIGSVLAYNTVTLKSRVDGQILSVNFKEGQFVKEGDLLVQIDPRPYQVMLDQAEGQLAKDQASLTDAKVNYDRYVALYREQVIPKQQLDTQQSQVGLFEGSIQSDRAAINNAKLQLVYCKITSPINGRVGLRLVDAGNIIHATDTTGMLVITQMQPIAVTFSLPQDSLPEVYRKLRNNEQPVVEAFDSGNNTKIATGKLETIDNQIDATTGTYKLKAVFPNEDHGLFPNQFVNVRMLLDTKRGLTLVPSASVQRGPDGSFVYMVADKKAKVQHVTVGLSEGETVGLTDGVQPGEVVVVDGMDKLQDGVPVETGSGRKRESADGDGLAAPQGKADGQAAPQDKADGQPAVGADHAATAAAASGDKTSGAKGHHTGHGAGGPAKGAPAK